MKNRLSSLALAGVLSLSLILPVGAANAAARRTRPSRR